MSADKVHRVPLRKGNVKVQCGSSRTGAEVLEQGYFSPQHQTSLEEALRVLSAEPDISSRERGQEWQFVFSPFEGWRKVSWLLQSKRGLRKKYINCHLCQPQPCPVRAQLCWDMAGSRCLCRS